MQIVGFLFFLVAAALGFGVVSVMLGGYRHKIIQALAGEAQPARRRHLKSGTVIVLGDRREADRCRMDRCRMDQCWRSGDFAEARLAA